MYAVAAAVYKLYPFYIIMYDIGIGFTFTFAVYDVSVQLGKTDSSNVVGSNVWGCVPTQVEKRRCEQEVLRGISEMNNNRRLRRKKEAFQSSVTEAVCPRVGRLLVCRLVRP